MSARKKSPDVTTHSDHVTSVITGKLIIKNKSQATRRKRFRKKGRKQTNLLQSQHSFRSGHSNKQTKHFYSAEKDICFSLPTLIGAREKPHYYERNKAVFFFPLMRFQERVSAQEIFNKQENGCYCLLLTLLLFRFHDNSLSHLSPLFLFSSDAGWETQA